MKVTQAVCLVGGRGSRLGSLTTATPKPLLNVDGKPFLDYLVHEARRHGLRRLLLLTGYLSEEIAQRYHQKSFGLLDVAVVAEAVPAGTAGALANAAAYLDDTFFLLNGDSFFGFNWLSLVEPLDRVDWTIHMALANGVAGSRYGRVEIYGRQITGFRAQSDSTLPINAGIYLVRRHVVDHIKSIPCSLEREILPDLARLQRLAGIVADGDFIDIGVPDDFARAQRLIPAYLRRPAVFLDAAAALRHSEDCVSGAGNILWSEGAIDAIRGLNDSGYYAFLMTKPASGWDGPDAEGDVHSMHNRIQGELQGRGAHFDAFECRPCLRDGRPTLETILKLQQEWPTDPAQSFVIGSQGDVDGAVAAGLQGYKFDGGSLLDFVRRRLVR